MDNKKKRFLKNFTWKKYFLFSCTFFVITLLVMVIWEYFDPGEKVADLFTQKELIERVVLAIIMGFVLAVLIKPDADEKKPETYFALHHNFAS
jgi:hypothetical protein